MLSYLWDFLLVTRASAALQMEDHFAALNELVDGTPLTSERCSSIRDILLEVHHCCSESGEHPLVWAWGLRTMSLIQRGKHAHAEATCSEVLKRSQWLGHLMTLLDDSTFSDLPGEDLPQCVPNGVYNDTTPILAVIVAPILFKYGVRLEV